MTESSLQATKRVERLVANRSYIEREKERHKVYIQLARERARKTGFARSGRLPDGGGGASTSSPLLLLLSARYK